MIPDYTSSGFLDLLSMRGRTAAVTGGANGIGAAICERLAELGADLAIGDLSAEQAQKLAEDLSRRFSVKAIGVALDVRQAASVEAFADAAVSMSGKLDIWVNNAGIYPLKNIVDMPEDEWDTVMDINLRGSFLGTKAAAKRMRPTGETGHSSVIINIASMTAIQGREGRAHYTASKHGVLGLTKASAREFGANGIRVLAIAPTMVMTPGLAELAKGANAARVKAVEDSVRARLPLGRVCVPDDVARVAVFCASDLSAMMTGSIILVDAGDGTG